MTRVLVTGASGMLGGAVARALADDRVGEAPRAGADGPSTVGDVFDATFGPEMERLREQITALHEG